MSTPEPPCFHNHIRVVDWDNGADPETGYRDAGNSVTCLTCGEKFLDEEFNREQETIARDLNPQAGDVYLQFDCRLVIVESGGDDVYYVCRDGQYSGPLRSVPLQRFRHNLRLGILTRVRGSAIK